MCRLDPRGEEADLIQVMDRAFIAFLAYLCEFCLALCHVDQHLDVHCLGRPAALDQHVSIECVRCMWPKARYDRRVAPPRLYEGDVLLKTTVKLVSVIGELVGSRRTVVCRRTLLGVTDDPVRDERAHTDLLGRSGDCIRVELIVPECRDAATHRVPVAKACPGMRDIRRVLALHRKPDLIQGP